MLLQRVPTPGLLSTNPSPPQARAGHEDVLCRESESFPFCPGLLRVGWLLGRSVGRSVVRSARVVASPVAGLADSLEGSFGRRNAETTASPLYREEQLSSIISVSLCPPRRRRRRRRCRCRLNRHNERHKAFRIATCLERTRRACCDASYPLLEPRKTQESLEWKESFNWRDWSG